jgi:hypothetical protein
MNRDMFRHHGSTRVYGTYYLSSKSGRGSTSGWGMEGVARIPVCTRITLYSNVTRIQCQVCTKNLHDQNEP